MKPSPPQPSEKSGEKIRVLSRLYSILRALNDHPDGLSLREISQYVKLPLSTVWRIVSSLEDQNMVITAPTTNAYRLGPTLALFAANIRPFDIAKIARPMFMQLAGRTDESIHLCVVAHGMAVVVDQIFGIHPARTVSTIGTSLPLYATAVGKALLAAMPEKQLEALRPHMPLVGFTENTITDWGKLVAEIEKIRETGVSVDHQEHQQGISGVAIPLKGPGGEIGAIGIPLPTERFQVVGEQLVQLLRILPRQWDLPKG